MGSVLLGLKYGYIKILELRTFSDGKSIVCLRMVLFN